MRRNLKFFRERVTRRAMVAFSCILTLSTASHRVEIAIIAMFIFAFTGMSFLFRKTLRLSDPLAASTENERLTLNRRRRARPSTELERRLETYHTMWAQEKSNKTITSIHTHVRKLTIFPT